MSIVFVILFLVDQNIISKDRFLFRLCLLGDYHGVRNDKHYADKFQGIVLPGSRNNANVQVSLGGVDIAFVKKIDVLGVCIDGKLRALRFVLKDHTSSYNDLLLKSGFDSFSIYAVKSLMTELFKILEGMAPDYLSELFVKADTPYGTRDKCKLIQPIKRTTTYGLRSFQYYGTHVWNMLPINIKAAQSLYEFKSFIRSWPGPTCSCQICTALL